ncbi:conserved unknown protein [Ectocarpus siliculosus]|uniref:Uncharacterized protein n=1 Tax=Ectocarpus siliculosus TaxID=2880 RepID=D7FJI2_ECTSI|nr:conserved unknown protein [Ectocarpus siliculosus]|eukprot:CBJ29085.1 conserved unknown protein [Ectocarpus siliculosus]
MSTKRGAPAPAVVGSHFVKQYYGEVLSKKPVELHRFYKDESTFCHASGTKEEEPVSGLEDIKAKIKHLGLGGATVDLGCGSVDAQPSEGGGVLLMVTGSITIANTDPRQFCQTFFLARQHQDNDRHNYFVRNDIFRFLDVLPEVVQAALKARDEEDGSTARSALPPAEESSKPESVGEETVAAAVTQVHVQDTPVPQQTTASPVATAAVPESSPPAMAAGAAPPSESQVAASTDADADAGAATAATAAATVTAPAAVAGLDNGSADKTPAAKVPPSPVGASTPAESTETAAAEAAPPASPLPPAAPAAPPAPMTYASLAKSWATVAADSGSGVGAAAAVGAPASAASPSGNGNGIATSNGGWGAPDPAAAAAGAVAGGAVLTIEQPVGQPGPGVVQHGSRPSSATGKGQKGPGAYIPHHASPAVAASAAAAREAAAAGNGEIMPATSLFVRKVDMTIDRDEMIAHFSAYGEVTGISMNPTRGYAFIDYRTNECVQIALSTKEHYVNRKLLVVEERHSPMVQRNSRGEHGGGRGGRNGGRGRVSSGRDGRDGDRRPTGRGGRDRPDGPKDGGYRARGRAEA